jgi:transcriptional regulator GlxA family with amidase domain
MVAVARAANKRQNEEKRVDSDNAPQGRLSMSHDTRPLIALLATPETSSSVLYGLYDVLWSAGATFGEMTTGKAGDPLIDVRIVAAGAEPFHCPGNVLVEPHAAVGSLDRVDVAIVCDVYTPIDSLPRERCPEEVAWIRRMHEHGAIVASVCSGSLVVAETGLLDGLEATGHWAYRELSRAHFPKVKWREDSVICLAGEEKRIVTAGGVTAWQDLALYLIARFCGPEHAIQTAKVHLMGDHADGQLPFAVMTQRVQQTDALISDCQIWIAENYASPNPVARMAERAGLQARTFARRFRAATGYQPMEYVHALRIEEAKQFLEREPMAIDQIGAEVGYEDPTFFRRLFKRKVGLTPAAYRKKFASVVPGRTFAPHELRHQA